MIDGRLREVWEALGCAPNPDDFKEEVQASMWREAVKLIREQSAGVTRVHRENAKLLRTKAEVKAEALEEAADDLGGEFLEVALGGVDYVRDWLHDRAGRLEAGARAMAGDRGRIPFNQTVGNEQT